MIMNFAGLLGEICALLVMSFLGVFSLFNREKADEWTKQLMDWSEEDE
tara:strand:- start:285 stop:428 length:144 start_codon:yes stop_codon:yes gene_type:complete